MALRCLLFCADEGTAEPICQVLAGLGVEGESCSEAVTAVERVTSQSFQIVIIDWDMLPEAGFLLSTARERKASERPLTLAIVSDDASVPKALQAGANSILRKPILVNQVKDTLTTARDLLRSRQESAATAAQAAAAAAAGATSSSTSPLPVASTMPASIESGNEKGLHAGEFLQTTASIPGAQFDVESEAHTFDSASIQEQDPVSELEPMAGSVAEEESPAPGPATPTSNEPRGLQWYLNARAAVQAAAPPQAAPPAPPASSKPELLAFEQSPTQSSSTSFEASAGFDEETPAPAPPAPQRPARAAHEQAFHDKKEQKAEAQLFAYIAGEKPEVEEETKPRRGFGKLIVGALVLAGCAIVVAPQAPWHSQIQALFVRGQKATHAWLNPQPVTTAPAPAAHEDFSRAGDEYKLPAAEAIPDATTDPSQIRVVPVVDPTAKKPTTTDPASGQPVAPADGTTTNPTDPAQPVGTPAGTQVQESPAAGETTTPAGAAPGGTAPPTGSATTTPTPAPAMTEPAHSDPPSAPAPATIAPVQPAPRNPQPQAAAPTNNHIPSSLKSQMASMTPDASGNKPPEAALPSIEPVVVSEPTERALLTDQPPLDYPAAAGNQKGTVILQVLVGRDGSVQDAKFMQGSLAFARSAIEGVKRWKFSPYLMNGRPASVQTQLTINFKP